ncbi:MAG: AMP-binding protein, partial [Deltaproteobacteria bacterium]|nr:AMP-binding protein [Deltaproteobacteria bacterium]
MTRRVDGQAFEPGRGHMAPHLLVARAMDSPDEIVLENVGSRTASTHRELLDSVTRWASALAEVGVADGDFVVTMLTDQGDGLRAWLGAAFAGGIEVPINPQHRGDLLRTVIDQVAPRVVVVDPAIWADLDPEDLRASETILLTDDDGIARGHGRIRGLGPLLAKQPSIHEPPPLGPADTAAIIFTSGTTGPSKGVVVPWATAYQLVSWVPDEAFGSGEAVYCPLPMFHMAGKSTFTNVLARGARLVYREKFSASSFLDDVRSKSCVAANIVGPMVSFLHETPVREDDAANPLRAMLCGPMIPEIEEFKQRFGVAVATCYGMTEIGSVLATSFDHGPWNSCGQIRKDYPWPEVRIVDADDRDIEPGTVGELVVRTDCPSAFSPGYLRDAAKTADAWRNGWFHSGDAFRVDDAGHYYLVDRYKDTIRRRGENVSSYEVEMAITAHEGVAECAAVAAPGAHGDDDIIVFVIATHPGAVDAVDLDRWASARLPSYMCPSEYRVVQNLPRNATSMRVK